MYRTDQLIASSFALCGFAAAMVAGAAAGNPSNSVIGLGLLAMFVCYFIGLAGSKVALVAVNEHLAQHREANPVEPVLTQTELRQERERAEAALEQATVPPAPAQPSAEPNTQPSDQPIAAAGQVPQPAPVQPRQAA